jgi:mediator of RNA polymerase II transcription subunit 7
MAQQQQQEQDFPSSFFPDPPPFWRNFTTENLDRLRQAKSEAPGDVNDGAHLSAAQLLELPPEVRCLVPPEPPADDDEYRVFSGITKGSGMDHFNNALVEITRKLNNEGGHYFGVDIEGEPIPVLPNWKYEQLYPTSSTSSSSSSQSSLDRQQYLLRFIRSILLNYLELLGIVATNPKSEDKDEKLKDILTLVANVHALVNEYRPHQARETLIGIMEDQLERKKAEVEGVRRMGEKVRETLRDFESNAPDKDADAKTEEAKAESLADEKRIEMQRSMWQAMDEIVGH